MGVGAENSTGESLPYQWSEDVLELRACLLAEKAESSRLRDLLGAANLLHATDVNNLTDLLASEAALALSQAETRVGRSDLLVSEAALISSQAETEVGKSDLLASAIALAFSREETEERKSELLASALALASSQAKTKKSETELLASEIANKTMSLSNTLLVAGKAALRKSEEQFRRLVEGAPNAMVMIDPDGKIEMVNTQTERMFGYCRQELVGNSVEMLLPQKVRGRHSEMRSGFFSAPTARPMGLGRTLFGLRKDGSQVEVEIGLSPIETEEGMMVLSTIVDISHRVRLEGQVQQSQKMQVIGRVTAGVAHDFNNLLQILGGSLEILIEAVGDNVEAAEWGNVALRATTRGKELTERLLSFSRQQLLVAHPIMIDHVFSDLNQLIGHLFEMNTRAKTELIMVPCMPGLAVMADLAQLETALINLAMNARDAMTAGGCLRISAYAADADPLIVSPGRYTVISIADTGCGMDADTLAQACEPFFSTKGLQGTGLGLSMVQGFARQSGGDAHITSAVGEGTTIDLWLPSVCQPLDIKLPTMLPVKTMGRVLVADDSDDALLVISTFLRSAGMDVTSKLNGASALAELTKGRRFDALITDFAMPGMNGLELLLLAREIDPTMPGVVITGFSDPELISELDNISLLRKPFNRAELISVVQTVIGLKASGIIPTSSLLPAGLR